MDCSSLCVLRASPLLEAQDLGSSISNRLVFPAIEHRTVPIYTSLDCRNAAAPACPSLLLSCTQGEDTALHTAVKAGEEGMLRMLLIATRRWEVSDGRRSLDETRTAYIKCVSFSPSDISLTSQGSIYCSQTPRVRHPSVSNAA